MEFYPKQNDQRRIPAYAKVLDQGLGAMGLTSESVLHCLFFRGLEASHGTLSMAGGVQRQ